MLEVGKQTLDALPLAKFAYAVFAMPDQRRARREAPGDRAAESRRARKRAVQGSGQLIGDDAALHRRA